MYRPPQGNRFYLRVLDDGSDATNTTKVALIRGYEVMTGIDTGTGDFPTAAQMSTGLFVSKSTTADATARPWMILADEKRLVMFNGYSHVVADAYNHWGFGDLVGASAADAYASFIYGCNTTANAVNTLPGGAIGRGNVAFSAIELGMYSPRLASGAGTAIGALTSLPSASTNGSGSNTFDPPLSNGDVAIDAIQVCNGTTNVKAPRGRFPGVHHLRHYLDAAYPTGTKLGPYEVVRFNSPSQAYLIDTGNWE